ncbi:MAG: DUF1801 domain-containing protein [Pseudomonadota bacterium]
MSVPAISQPVHAAMSDWPADLRAQAERVRAMIYEVAAETGSAPVEETLKWGQPSFSNGKAGTPLRLGYVPGDTLPLRLLVHCSTTLIDQCRTRFGELTYETNRAICLSDTAPLPETELKACIALAQDYHAKAGRDA